MNNTTNKKLWEEENSIEPEKNSEHKSASEIPVITPSTENELEKKECENTGKKWVKNCPECGKLQEYSTKYSLRDASTQNSKCKKCSKNLNLEHSKWTKECPNCNCKMYYASKIGLNVAISNNSRCRKCQPKFRPKINCPPDGWTKKCPTCYTDMKYTARDGLIKSIKNNCICYQCNANKKIVIYDKSELCRQCPKCNGIIRYKSMENMRKAIKKLKLCRSCARLGKTLSKQTIEKIVSKTRGQKRTEKTRERLRIATLNTLEKLGIPKIYSIRGCDFMDKLNIKNICNLQHGRNGGEVKVCGYSVDGYDKEQNIVFEYDEKHHYDIDGKLKENDIRRMINIINKLQCRFFRYNERTKTLYEVILEDNVCNYKIINDGDLKML